MSEIIELLEHELETAVEVKDRGALHRYVTILVDRVVSRGEHAAAETRLEKKLDTELGALRSDVQTIAARMEQGFARMDERFAAMDKRFEDMQAQMDRRFEQVDKRFEDMQAQMERRFEQVDKRFEQVDKRFEDVNKRFDDVNKRFGMLVGLTTTFFVVLAGLMTALRIFG